MILLLSVEEVMGGEDRLPIPGPGELWAGAWVQVAKARTEGAQVVISTGMARVSVLAHAETTDDLFKDWEGGPDEPTGAADDKQKPQ